jgi:hypothetical protein
MNRLRVKRMQCFRNFYNYAKEAVAGTIGGGGDSPQFQVEVANRYYPDKYQVRVRLQQGPLSWFPYLPEKKFGRAFDMSLITPSLVRKVLGSKKATSARGPDGHSVFPFAPGGS